MRYNQATDHYEPVSWDDAFALIADTLKGLNSPDEVEFYTSGRASNEASYLYQLFGRLFGTNNFPDCSNMCHEASGVALIQSVGIGKGLWCWMTSIRPMRCSSMARIRVPTIRA